MSKMRIECAGRMSVGSVPKEKRRMDDRETAMVEETEAMENISERAKESGQNLVWQQGTGKLRLKPDRQSSSVP